MFNIIREMKTKTTMKEHIIPIAAAAKSLQSCLTLCDPIDSSPPGSSVPGILQPRTLEWVAISFSNAWMWKVKVKLLSRVWLLATPWTAAYRTPLSMGFSRQEYWSGVPLPSSSHCIRHSQTRLPMQLIEGGLWKSTFFQIILQTNSDFCSGAQKSVF